MSITATNVSKRFGSFVALDNVTVECPAGQLVALLGPSGSGKTTLLRIIAGLEVADSGTVHYRDDDIDTVLDALDRRSTAAALRLRRLEARDWARIGLGSDGTERTALVLARRLAHDGHHHLMDLERILTALTTP